MESFFLKILHEEPLDKLTLESIKGGDSCICFDGASYTCTCHGGLAKSFSCTCNGDVTSFTCTCNKTTFDCKMNKIIVPSV